VTEVTANLDEEHNMVYELIPWFVNGTLAGPEQSLVERHVNACLVCKRAVGEEKRVRQLVLQHSDEAIGISEGFRDLMSRVDSDDLGARRRRAGYASGLVDRRGGWAIAAGIVLALAVFSWYSASRSPGQPEPQFSTTTDTVPHSDSQLLDIVFVSGLTIDERDALIAGFDAEIVSGPSELGRYTIAYGSERQSPEATEDLLTMLRSDERIRFVGRTFIEPESGP